MNSPRAILKSLAILNRSPAILPPCSQVCDFSRHSRPLWYLRPNYSRPCHLLYTHQKRLYSSKPDTVLGLVLASDWTSELEHELQMMNSMLTHETVMFVLKKLDKEPQKSWDFFNWISGNNGFLPSSSMYSLMLRVFVRPEWMKQFWVTLTRMKERGFYIEEETYLTILGLLKKQKMASDVAALTHFYNKLVQENASDGVAEKVVSVVLGSNWGSDVEKELEELEISPSDNFVIRVLKKLRSHPLKALRFFHWVGEQKSYGHNTVTYNAICRVLAQSDSIEEFWSLVKEMKDAGYEMDIDTYIKISRQFQKFKMMEDAVKLYELVGDGPYKPSVQHCSMLLRSLSGSPNPDLDLVFRVANKHESVAVLPKAVYDGIHRSLTSAGRFDEARKIMTAMKDARHEPDNITYSQVVFGLCKARRFDEAYGVLDEMEACGCIPDIKTWTVLIHGHCAADEVDEALACLAKMMGKTCDPDADLLDVLVNGFLSRGRADGACTFLVEMVNRVHLRPWQATYKHLIEKLLGERKLDEALKLLVLMKKHNYPPFPEPFIQYISKFGTVEDACEFLKALTVKQYPSVTAYLHLFRSFFKEGRHSEARDLLFKCPHHIRKHDEICKLFGSAKGDKVGVS